MKKVLLLLIIAISTNVFSQSNKFSDFLITKNKDTIFGNFNFAESKFYDFDKKSYVIDSTIVKLYYQGLTYENLTVSPTSFNSVENDSLTRLNGEDYFPFLIPVSIDKTHLFFNKIDKISRQDYALSINGDTIKGVIRSRNDVAKFKFVNKKLKIKPKFIHFFRKDGFEYFYKKKRKITPFDKGKAYLKLIYNGNVKLYEYKRIINQHKLFGAVEKDYYLEISDNIYLIPRYRFTKFLLNKFPDKKEVIAGLSRLNLGVNNIFQTIRFIDNEQ
ncbi:hypothetical protein [Tenacibaculum sp. C7A-26P2]|uniref:hypothetical protein n=1 Tax=Tenacibaculum sp. C7A-26P2 TaxID=3447504 RepID=UPI003F847DDA